ncbi:hypothetical protein PoB_006875900 [Plakobranchus ocellatus]|uniref:Uncharacterized protein n=1 Tax=Plakobranchus ocellatus TaxID=259542 RepID=A0AAV4DDQ2_9GAST|nr:hypothetical protein PoB_006875900 [Plakobranchus ocellatus]
MQQSRKSTYVNQVLVKPSGKNIGQHLHTLECRSQPYRLAVLDSSSIRHTVAVTLPRCSGIGILEVNRDNMEVKHLHTLECRSKPFHLAVLDSSSIRHTVAVTLPLCFGIDILEVNGDNMEVKRTLQTSRDYWAVAAVNNLTLAVGYWPGSGIDLIDLGGQVLRQICSSVRPRYMDITEDGGLVCSTVDNKIARVQVVTGTVVFNKSGLQALRQARAQVAGLEPGTKVSLQISRRIRYLLCHSNGECLI